MPLLLVVVVALTPAPRPDDTQQSGDEVILPDLHGPPPEPCKSAGPLWQLLDVDTWLAAAIGYVIASPFIVPSRILEAKEPRAYLYERRPFAHRHAGLIRFEPEPELTIFPTLAVPSPPQWQTDGKRSVYRLLADAALLGDGEWRARTQLRIQTPSRAEFDIDAANYALAGDHDLAVFAGHAHYRFAQSTAMQFRAGFGARVHTDDRATYGGVDAVYGFDAALAKPLMLSASAGIGNAGKHLTTDLRASLGVVVEIFELTIGYEQLVVGHTGYAGPTAGIRIWL